MTGTVQPSVVDVLREANDLLEAKPPRHKDAAALVANLIESIDPVTAQQEQAPLQRIVDRFFKKNAKDLNALLAKKLEKLGARPSKQDSRAQEIPVFKAGLHDRLALLSERHIFQWATFYREDMSTAMAEALVLAGKLAIPTPVAAVLEEEFVLHAREVFSKGYERQLRDGRTEREALSKGSNGLRKFLELPLQYYAQTAARYDLQARDARALRVITSAVLTGILRGFGTVLFGEIAGFTLLAQNWTEWTPHAAFLTSVDLGRVLNGLGDSRASRSLRLLASAPADAIDRFLAQRAAQDFSLPMTALVSQLGRQLSVTMSLPKQDRRDYLQVRCFCCDDGESITKADLDECDRADADIIVAPLEADLREQWYATHKTQSLVAYEARDPEALGTFQSVSDRIVDALSKQAAASVGGTWLDDPLIYNYAADFPLNNPQLLKFYLVQRQSVLNLLGMFESRTGVHLWCSVRRSGKTTACSELGSTSGGALVAFQTMELKPEQPDANVLYTAIQRALDSGAQIPPTFVQDIVKECAGATLGLSGTTKTVLVLDEYEILFGRLRVAGRRDEALRYSVVYPLLNQLVSFARDNLLILVGQQPDAHYIFLEHNPLSPLALQASFPLFEHKPGAARSEFADFLRRVLTARVDFDSEFADAVFEETKGHPYLTVNVMTDVFDWMIEHVRRARDLTLSRSDFATFVAERLIPAKLGTSRRYEFFHRMLGRFTGSDTREEHPWLHSVTSCVKAIGEAAPNSFRVDLPAFKKMAVPFAEACRLSPDELLVSAEKSNFLSYQGGYISPAIRIMGRLALVSRPSND